MSNFKKTPYKVNVRALMRRPGEMREQQLTIVDTAALGEGLVAVVAGTPMEVELRLESVHEGILVTADVTTVATGECGRCLTDIALPVEVDIQELFAYPSQEACEFEVQDDHVDLEPIVRDAVVLALPFQPVCRPDCPGLDPETGELLAENTETEPLVPANSPWSALAGFQASTGNSADDDIDADTDREKS